jgi:hypothetical protein
VLVHLELQSEDEKHPESKSTFILVPELRAEDRANDAKNPQVAYVQEPSAKCGSGGTGHRIFIDTDALTVLRWKF